MKYTPENSVKSFYDDFSNRQLKAGINERHKAIINHLTKKGLQNHHNVLEIGCGIGTLSRLLIKKIKKGSLTAVDISPKSIEIAKTQFLKSKNVSFIAVDVTEWVPQKQYDVIVMADVLEHIPIEKHKALFQKIHKLLKPNGFVGINIPNPYFQDYCKTKGMEMQIIDLSLHLDKIVNNLKNTGLYIHYLEKYAVWNYEGDYQFMIFRNESYQAEFHNIEKKKSFIKKALEKIQYEYKKFKK